jgi:cytochrome c2
MFDTMTVTKASGAFLGALLIFLLGNWAATVLYTVDGHGEASYVIDTGAEEEETEVEEVASLSELLAQADTGKGEKLFKKCAACHKLEEGANSTGPYLYGVVGRPIGAVADFSYSDVLAGMGGEWTAEHLDGYLTKPSAYAPGTKMSFAGLPKPQDRADVIAFLNDHSDSPVDFAEAPAEEAPAETAEAPAEEAPAEAAEAPAEETPADTAEAPAEEAPADTAEAPAEEAPADTAEAPAEEAPAEAAEAPAEEAPAAEAPAADTAVIAGDVEAGEKVFKKCKACHKVEDGKNGVGPHLHNVIGRPIASVDGFKFSSALTGLGGDWTPERLDAYLTKPSDFAKGTKMTFAGLKDKEDRDNVIAYLNSVAD